MNTIQGNAEEFAKRILPNPGTFVGNFLNQKNASVKIILAYIKGAAETSFYLQNFMNWSVSTYKKSTSLSCMTHLKRECDEVLEETDKGKQLVEFADCFMCLLSAAAREGFDAEQLIDAIRAKAEINYKRKWVLNPDNTYSHVKEPQPQYPSKENGYNRGLGSPSDKFEK